MGLFSSDIPKIFKTREEVRRALLEIKSLDYKERPKVFDAIVAQLDHGGLTKLELLEVIRDLRSEHAISEVDERHLKELLEANS